MNHIHLHIYLHPFSAPIHPYQPTSSNSLTTTLPFHIHSHTTSMTQRVTSLGVVRVCWGGFLDPKARGMNLGYDQAVALPAMQADGKSGQEDIFKETNKAMVFWRMRMEVVVVDIIGSLKGYVSCGWLILFSLIIWSLEIDFETGFGGARLNEEIFVYVDHVLLLCFHFLSFLSENKSKLVAWTHVEASCFQYYLLSFSCVGFPNGFACVEPPC